MKIVIDARMYQESGIGRYIRNLLTQLQELDKQNEYLILHLEKDLHRLEYAKNFKGISADFRWYGVTEQIKLPKLLKKLKPDLVHFPHFNVPLFSKGKFVVTIHDLIHQHFNMSRATTHGALIHKIKQIGYKRVFKNAIDKSAKILVPSNYVKELLVKEWKVDRDKVVVTQEAVDDKLLNLVQSAKCKVQSSLEKLNIKKPYIFYVGNAHPHKNVEGLIKAFKDLKEKYPYLQLVLAGGDHYFWQRVKRENVSDGIIYTNFISDEEMVVLYQNSQAFVLPSFEEGFGIPVLEAFACGCPVVSSNAGSLKEVGGEAAIYFDPTNKEEIVQKIDQVLKDERLRQDLIKKGLQRYKQFSWRKLAEQTLEVYKKCVLQ